MNENLKKWLADLAKWILIVIVSAIAFYLVCPKYDFFYGPNIRGNRMTGDTEILRGDKWESLREPKK